MRGVLAVLCPKPGPVTSLGSAEVRPTRAGLTGVMGARPTAPSWPARLSAAGAEGQNAAQACAWVDGWGGPQGRGAVKSRMAPSAERGART